MDTIPITKTHSTHTVNHCMHKSVYYLKHKDTGQRLRYYRTRAGARVAQRSRNAHLGFQHRLERVESFENWEVERCELSDGTIVDATWVIEEDTIEQETWE